MKRAMLNEIKAERGCFFCGEKEPLVLDFHHIDPSKKEADVSKIASIACLGNVQQMLDEVDKCIVVCANDHRRLHAGKLTIPNSGD